MLDSVRAHELRKYFNTQAVLPTSPNRKINSAHDRATESTTFHDGLTAFSQVVKARLGVLGAFVCLTDGHTQYVVAGSVGDSDDDDETERCVPAAQWFAAPDDAGAWIWLARQVLGVAHKPAAQRCFCIPDLSVDEHTRKLLHVMRPPKLRFYAAVPLVTKLDIPIGALFVVTDTVRHNLSERERSLLQRMATRCMSHLDMAREVESKRRSLSMSEGVDSFIQHRETGAPSAPNDNLPTLAKDARKKFTPGIPPKQPSAGESTNIPQDRHLSIPEEEADDQVPPSSMQAVTDPGDDTGHGGTTFRKTFARAAGCLRTALKVDGVMFVNGFIGLHSGLLPVGEPELELEREMRAMRQTTGKRQTEGAAMNSDAHNEGMRTYTSADYRKGMNTNRPAEILGYSIQPGQRIPPRTRLAETTSGLVEMDEGFLQHFLERHSEGRTWYFSEEGTPFRFDGGALVLEDDKDGDATCLTACFPGARQIIFSPLTDPVTLKHLAGCFAWTSDVFPVLTDETDLCPFKAFLHSVVAEISRLDTVAAVEQQASFVSSVSHELRSPLHGILGAVELLAETNLDHFQRGLADTIRSCGSTLHDTLSNVLSYAKINDFEQKQCRVQNNKPKDSPWALENKATEAVRLDGSSSGLFVSTNIATLCEDIMEVVETGHSYSKLPLDSVVTVTLDIAYHEHWTFETEPGALRRIMMNIIGNAVKHSPKGSVVVSLDFHAAEEVEQQNRSDTKVDSDESLPEMHSSEGEKQKIVIFTVKDSGKGMSKDFLENRLFLPFHQEDAVKSEGVGLGMSIVKSLVSLLAGKIEVKSQVGKGTEFKISIPMVAGAIPNPDADLPTFEQNITTLRNERLNVAVHGFEDNIARSLREYLVAWFDCKMVVLEDEDVDPCILFVDETRGDTFEEIRSRLKRYGRRLAVLTVSTGAPKPARSKYFAEKHIWERIPRPFGPNKVSKALLRSLERLQALRESDTEPGAEGQEVTSTAEDARPVTPVRPGADLATAGETPHPDSSPKLHPSLALRYAPAASTKTGPSILLVEDNLVNLKLLQTFMSKKGYTDVKTAADGLLAVQAVKKRVEGFDIIITDISMPVMDGFEACRRIRDLERARSLQNSRTQRPRSSSSSEPSEPKPALLVALTGLASASDREQALRCGVDLFVTKPVKFGKLGELLVQWERGEIGPKMMDGVDKESGKA